MSIGLIPNPLGRLFIQLISSIKQNEIYQCRAIHLLFLLCPIRLVQQIIKPLFELMATVANQPDCEVDKTSLVVLFSPIFFLDRSTTIPISLANPLPIHVLNLCVKLARDELKTNLSVTRLFQVPSLFLHDCTRTLILHQDPDHHLYPNQHILISLSLPNQTDQKLSSNLDHLNRNNDGLQHDDMNDRNHLSGSHNNNIISFENFPSTTKHVSIVNIPKCDYVQMSS
ncbi:unnamed protein product [Schistosoma haematobium]|nr:unnamed protein product [Schistosoma haematobium]